MSLIVLPPKQRLSLLSLLPARAALQRPRPTFIDTDGRRIEWPEEAVTLLEFVLKAWNDGHGVTVSVLSEMLTTQEAANRIGCSRQHVVSLMNSGVLPGRKIGTHRRIQLHDVLSFIDSERKQQDKQQDKQVRIPETEKPSVTFPVMNGQ